MLSLSRMDSIRQSSLRTLNEERTRREINLKAGLRRDQFEAGTLISIEATTKDNMPSTRRSSTQLSSAPLPTSRDSHEYSDDTKAATKSILSVMMKQERTIYACRDYLNANKVSQATSHSIEDEQSKQARRITASDRQRVIDWCYDIIDECDLNRETMTVAVNLFDRFMSTPSRDQNRLLYHRGQYQLLIITAVYVAVKTNEPITFSSSDFAAVTHNTYTETELEEMEQTLLNGINWRCCVPTPQQIGMHILELLKLHLIPSQVIHPDSPTWNLLEEELAFQSQSAVRDYFFTTQRSSTIAAISFLNTIEQVNDVEYEPLMRTLINEVFKKFEFEDASALLYSRHRLRSLIGEHHQDDEAGGEEDDSNSDTPSRRSCWSDEEESSVLEETHSYQQGQNEHESYSSQEDCTEHKHRVPLKRQDSHEVQTEALTCTSSLGASFTTLRLEAIHDDGSYMPEHHTIL